jgi:LPS-assembly lipoprotein
MRNWIVLLSLLVLSACGFHLRGSQAGGSYLLPYDRLYISMPETAELRTLLKRTIDSSSRTKVVDTAQEAQATLQVLGDSQTKNILSIGSDGRVREFQLVRSFAFRVQDKSGNELMPSSQIIIRRDITFSDANVLSKEAEEALLWREMQNDLTQQILRRLVAAKAQPHAE